jgi:zinc/manganese transport system permease protein
MPILLIGIIFMLLVAVATSIAVQVVGVLLIFSLMVTPAATAQRLASRPLSTIVISVAIALAATWLGLFIAFYEPYPVSFFITSLVFVFYLLIRFVFPKIRPSKVQKNTAQSGRSYTAKNLHHHMTDELMQPNRESIMNEQTRN